MIPTHVLATHNLIHLEWAHITLWLADNPIAYLQNKEIYNPLYNGNDDEHASENGKCRFWCMSMLLEMEIYNPLYNENEDNHLY